MDDERDVLDTMEALLPMCEVIKTTDFKEAKDILETRQVDIAILDIMGVNGYQLLQIATEKGVVAVMLTAHALSPEDTVKSFRKGAASYIPKEKMGEIVTYLNDILEAKASGKSSWSRWLERFAAYYDKKFGPRWRNGDEDFWNKFGYWQ